LRPAQRRQVCNNEKELLRCVIIVVQGALAVLQTGPGQNYAPGKMLCSKRFNFLI